MYTHLQTHIHTHTLFYPIAMDNVTIQLQFDIAVRNKNSAAFTRKDCACAIIILLYSYCEQTTFSKSLHRNCIGRGSNPVLLAVQADRYNQSATVPFFSLAFSVSVSLSLSLALFADSLLYLTSLLQVMVFSVFLFFILFMPPPSSSFRSFDG